MRSKRGAHHPLAARNPATRNITLPETVHARRGSSEATTPEKLRKQAQSSLARAMEQEVLWQGSVVDNADHHILQHFASLRANRKYREARQLFVVGGKEMIRELAQGGFHPKSLLVATDREVPPWVKSDTQIVRVDRAALEETAGGTDGYVGDFDIPSLPQKELLIANKQRLQRVLVLDNMADPGNLGTILRTSAAFCYDCVLMVNHCADAYDHEVVRAARGAHFQQLVPFYTLRDEDGDDVFGFINHMIQRNNLQPLCFTSHLEAQQDATATSSTVQRLSTFCQDSFSLPTSGGHIIFASPDPKKSLQRRLSERVVRPTTTLLIDEPAPEEFLTGLSSVLYALRPTGEWDYLPPALRSEDSRNGVAQQERFARAHIGPDRLIMDESCLNLDEEEQISLAREQLEAKRQRRVGRKGSLDDHDTWMNAEKARIRKMRRAEVRKLVEPWTVAKDDGLEDVAADHPSWAPNIINDYRDPMDRDILRSAKQSAEEYARPSNYDS